MTNLSSRARHSGARNFELGRDVDLQVSFIVLSSATSRYELLELPMRKLHMEVKLISDGKYYYLNTLARGTSEADDAQYWTERVLNDYEKIANKGQANGYVPLDSEGYIPAQYIKDVFVNETYIVADQSERLALTTVKGDIVIQEDSSTTWIKLNDANPSTLTDFTQLSNSGAVVSVNAQTGVVILDFDAVLAYGNSASQFNIALNTSSFATATNMSLADLQTALSDLSYYTQDDIDAFLALKADKSNILPLDGSLTFTPSLDNHPANKAYVDQVVQNAGLGVVSVVGELFIVDNTTSQNIADTYIKVDQFNVEGEALGSNVSISTNNIQISRKAYYAVTFTVSVDAAGTAGLGLSLAIYVDNVITSIRSQHTFESTTETEHMTMKGTLSLEIGQIVDIRAKTTNPGGTAIVFAQGSLSLNAVVSGLAADVKDNLAAVTAPTATDDASAGYSINSHWVDLANNIAYICVDVSIGAAVWKQISTGTYTHNQISAASLWTITHNLNKHPAVSVIDSGDNLVYGDINYINENSITVSFSAPFSGKAHLN